MSRGMCGIHMFCVNLYFVKRTNQEASHYTEFFIFPSFHLSYKFSLLRPVRALGPYRTKVKLNPTALCIYIYIYTCPYIQTYIHVYIYTYTRTLTHAHTHTHTQSFTVMWWVDIILTRIYSPTDPRIHPFLTRQLLKPGCYTVTAQALS